jgi:hypothetical protein
MWLKVRAEGQDVIKFLISMNPIMFLMMFHKFSMGFFKFSIVFLKGVPNSTSLYI